MFLHLWPWNTVKYRETHDSHPVAHLPGITVSSTCFDQAASTIHLHRTLNQIKSMGCMAGVVLNPGTPLSQIEYVLSEVGSVGCWDEETVNGWVCWICWGKSGGNHGFSKYGAFGMASGIPVFDSPTNQSIEEGMVSWRRRVEINGDPKVRFFLGSDRWTWCWSCPWTLALGVNLSLSRSWTRLGAGWCRGWRVADL